MDAAFFIGLIVLVVILAAGGPNKIDSPEPDAQTDTIEEVVAVDRD